MTFFHIEAHFILNLNWLNLPSYQLVSVLLMYVQLFWFKSGPVRIQLTTTHFDKNEMKQLSKILNINVTYLITDRV